MKPAALTVEFVGTILLVFVILSTQNPYAIGATLAIIIAIGKEISGGHFNPAVTISLIFANKIEVGSLLPYISAQILGGMAGYQIYKAII